MTKKIMIKPKWLNVVSSHFLCDKHLSYYTSDTSFILFQPGAGSELVRTRLRSGSATMN